MSCVPSSGVDHFAVGLEKSNLLTIGELAHADPVAALGGGIPQRDLAERQRHFVLDDAAGLVGLRIGLGVPLDAIDVLDHDFAAADANHGSTPAFVTAGEHYHLIALP